LKLLRFTLLLFIVTSSLKGAFAQPVAKKDSLVNYIEFQDQVERETKITRYIKSFFQNGPLNQLEAKKKSITDTFTGYSFPNKESMLYFMESIYQRRLSNLKESQKALVKAIDEAHKTTDHFLLQQYFIHLAFLQTDEGNFIEAINSYDLAKQEIKKLDDPRLEAILNVNISDVYYKSGLYSQSLSYLDLAQKTLDDNKLIRPNIVAIINYNKAENFFRTNNYDSLKVSHKKLFDPSNKSYKLYTYQKRTGYYLNLLKHDYKGAIQLINALVKDTLYVKNDLEEQLLADAYFSNGQLDSARYMVEKQLAQPAQANHPEIKYHLYELLGEIAMRKNDHALAADNFKLALSELKQNLNNLSQAGSKSIQLKINEYYVNQLKYEHERLWMMFAIALAILAVIIVAIFYRSSRQKRHYEQLLFAAKKSRTGFYQLARSTESPFEHAGPDRPGKRH
jgi:tetratricopeptide (TPR) repeat protein